MKGDDFMTARIQRNLTAYYLGKTLIYITDEHGHDYVTDKHFYEYMIDRKNTPEKVVLYSSKREMLQSLGVQL